MDYKYAYEMQSDTEWLNDKDDIPDSRKLIQVSDPDANPWLVLESHANWDQKRAADEDDVALSNKRDLWMQVRSYFVSEADCAKCWRWIRKQEFMGRWMPEGSEFYEGFVGEYPWATIFNVYPDSWSGRGGFGSSHPPCDLIPTCHTLSSHDEYDAYQTESIRLYVPSRQFFEGTKLRWDCCGGFVDGQSIQIFTDPSLVSAGPSVLLVKPDFLADFLSRHHLRIVWTVLAEKLVHGNNARERLQYSQAHLLSNSNLSSSKPLIKMH